MGEAMRFASMFTGQNLDATEEAVHDEAVVPEGEAPF
jgi:hypothetical protein